MCRQLSAPETSSGDTKGSMLVMALMRLVKGKDGGQQRRLRLETFCLIIANLCPIP